MIKKLFLLVLIFGLINQLFSQTNVANGIHSGGTAAIVEIAALGGGAVYVSDLSGNCAANWSPQGTLCNAADINSELQSTQQHNNSGATWRTNGN